MPASPGPFLAIFDHDGVLVDTLALHQQAWVELGRRTGLNVTPEFVHETFGMTNPMMLERILGHRLSEQEASRYSDVKEDCYRALARGTIGLMDGVRETLDALTALGVLLGIGSSGVRANLELTVRECGLDGRFAAITGLEDIRRGKPDPEVFLRTAERTGVPPERTVVFEDAPIGLQAARAAGMHAVGITTSHPAESLWAAGAEQVVESLVDYDVRPLLERLAARPL